MDLVKIRSFIQWKKGWVFCLTIEDVVFISLDQCRDAISQSKQTLVCILASLACFALSTQLLGGDEVTVSKQTNRKDVNAKICQGGQLEHGKGTFVLLLLRPVKTEIPRFT